MSEKKARILVGCVRRAYTRLFAVLTRYELSFVSTLADARAALQAGDFHLIMIGLSFDESRMFDLLQCVRTDAGYSQVPVVCFRGIEDSEGHGKLALEGVEAACKAMGANVFFDLLAFTDDARGNAAIRKLIDDLLGGQQNGK
jgi:hypothetical protein